MKISILKTLLFTGIIINISCRRVIEIPELNHVPQLVVKGAIGAGEPNIQLVFSESRGILNDDPIKFLKDGVEAKLFEDGVLLPTPRIEVLDVVENWNDDFWNPTVTYDTIFGFIWDVPAKEGATYRLEASHNGRNIKAQTTVPLVPEFFGIEKTVVQDREQYSFEMKDPEANKMNYYMIRVADINDFPTGFSIVNDPLIFNWETDGFEIEEPGYENFFVRGFFTDESFVNGKRRITFRVFDWNEPPSQNSLHVLHLEPIFYQYLKSTTINGFAGEGPFAEPVTVPDNIEGGMGIFTSYFIAKFPLQ